MWGKIIGFLLVPILLAGVVVLAMDDLSQRKTSALLEKSAVDAGATLKRVQDGEKDAMAAAQTVCARQAATSLNAGKIIQGLIDRPPSAPGTPRRIVSASDIQTIVGD